MLLRSDYLKQFEQLPSEMQNDKVREYYDILKTKALDLVLKRIVDIIISGLLILISSPIILICCIAIKLDSKGPVLFKQDRITINNKHFFIYKFRTMTFNNSGLALTTQNDSRITRVGKILRKLNFDEIPQLFNVIKGEMTIIGTRPEVQKYVEKYTDEMYATLLMRAGMLSEASIKYRNENALLSECEDPEKTYIETILPDKMKFNLEYYKKFNFFYDFKIIKDTIMCVFQKDENLEN
jgi:lipopolysaccharide/colanic/teichoic acid biosynthesis glycosyltransferase